jgi:hypothetical protein
MKANRYAEVANSYLHKFCIGLFFIMISLSGLEADFWLQDDWRGGAGQQMWNDPTMYLDGEGVEGLKSSGDLALYFPFWRKVGIDTIYRVGGVYDIVETEPGVLIAAAESDSGGLIFRSSNYGDSWRVVSQFQNFMLCRSLLLASNGLLYMGTYSDSGYIYRSDDSGFTWTKMAKLEDATRINSLLESNDGTIFAGTGLYGDIFCTQNAGTTWAKLTPPGSQDVWNLREDNLGRIYAACGSTGGLYRSMDQCQTWDTLLTGSNYIPDVLIDFDGNLYSNIAMWNILKSIDDGNSWQSVLDKSMNISEFLQVPDSSIYAGGICFSASRSDQCIYKTKNLGEDWSCTGGLSGYAMVICLTRAQNGFLYAGTEDFPSNGSIFRSSYYDSGYVVSSVFDTHLSPQYGSMVWNETLNGGFWVMKVRTSQDSLMTGAMPWDVCPIVTNGQDISSLISVDDGDRYIQYFGKLSTNNIYATPILHSVLITFVESSIAEDEKDKKKADIGIANIAPNPFINRTKISFSYMDNNKKEREPIIEIYDLNGRKVKTLRISVSKNENNYIYWDGDDDEGKIVSSGIYFFHLVLNCKRYAVKKVVKCE